MWRHINRNYSLWRRKKNEQSFQDTIKQFDIHITGITGKKKKGRFWGTKSLRKLWLKISQFDEKYQFTGMNLETALWVCPEQFISKMGASVLGQPVLRHLLGVERKKKKPHQPQFHIHKNILQMRVKYIDFQTNESWENLLPEVLQC